MDLIIALVISSVGIAYIVKGVITHKADSNRILMSNISVPHCDVKPESPSIG